MAMIKLSPQIRYQKSIIRFEAGTLQLKGCVYLKVTLVILLYTDASAFRLYIIILLVSITF
jgi:hypothetical protein